MKKSLFTVTIAGALFTGLAIGSVMPSYTWADTGAVEQKDEKTTEQIRLKMLENYVQPTSADSAIDLFVKSYQHRNGAVLFAILNPATREKSLQEFKESNWVLGASSPWIASYYIYKRDEKSEDVIEYQLKLLEYTSTGYMGKETVNVTVQKQGDTWFIDKYTPVAFHTDIDVFSEKLTNETAVGLAAEAQRRYWYLSAGGNGSQLPNFKPVGAEYDYRWLSEDIGTKENLQHYLEDLFSTPTVSTYMKDLFNKKRLMEEDGKLAQPDGDSGSLRDWASAKVTKLVQQGKMAKATMLVPLGEDDSETFEIDFVYQEKNGWKIATSPEIIR